MARVPAVFSVDDSPMEFHRSPLQPGLMAIRDTSAQRPSALRIRQHFASACSAVEPDATNTPPARLKDQCVTASDSIVHVNLGPRIFLRWQLCLKCCLEAY